MSSPVELQREAEWRACRGSSPEDWQACQYFFEHYVLIKHPERGRILFDLREAQVETLEAWLTNRYNITLKARQIGYSTLAANVALWLAFFWPDKPIILLSRTERESVKLFAKTGYAFRYLPQWMLARGPHADQRTLQKIVFSNESTIECLPSTQDPARGESAYLIVVDEWAFLENPEEAWASIEPVADVGGRVIGLSTANGSGNFFHQFWEQAVAGRGRFKPLFFPWSANSDRDDTWYEDKAEDMRMTPHILHQEYPRTPEEAFIKSGRNVFDTDALDRMEVLEPIMGQLWAQTEASRYAEFREHPHGELSLYEAPDPGTAYVIGADVAEGLEHGDYSSAHVLDVLTDCVVAHWHGHVDPDTFGNILFRLGFWYNTALLGVEANNHGLTTLVNLQKLRYPKLYYQRSVDQRQRTVGRKLGWHTLINTKGYVIDGLVQAMRGERQVNEKAEISWGGGMGVRDAKTIHEMKLYVREPDGKKMHGSPHDDRVMSLAIAQEMTKFAHAPEYQREGDHGWGTLSWWESQVDGGAPKPFVIGSGSTRKR